MSHNKRSSKLGIPEIGRLLDKRDVARFWSKVNQNGPVPPHCSDLGACWLWTASRQHAGYGQMTVMLPGGTCKAWPLLAHRIAWVLSHGHIPHGQWVLHHCDNPPCVNPAHLFLGDHKANMEDAAMKGRLHTPRPGKQTVTDAQLGEMLALRSVGQTCAQIAARFGVSKSYVSLFLQGKRRQYSLPILQREQAS